MSQSIVKYYQVQTNVNISLDAFTVNVQNVSNNFCIPYAATGNGLGLSLGFIFDQTNANLQIGNTAGSPIFANANINGNIFTGNLSVTQNIANTGNLSVTQNIATGNLTVTTNARIPNLVGTMNAANSPMVNTVTRVVTGLSANITANVQTTGTITGANVLPVIFNEVGMYSVQAVLVIGTTGNQTNATNVGLNIAFMNSGTAVINSLQYSVQARSNGNTTLSNLITTNAQTAIIPVGATQAGSIANSTNVTDFIILTGYANVNGVGTAQTMIAAGNTANSNLNVMPNSWIVFTKIG